MSPSTDEPPVRVYHGCRENPSLLSQPKSIATLIWYHTVLELGDRGTTYMVATSSTEGLGYTCSIRLQLYKSLQMDCTYLYPFSSVFEIWARQSRSWPFMKRVTIGTPCNITVRTCVVLASCEITACLLTGSATDIFIVSILSLSWTVNSGPDLNPLRTYYTWPRSYVSAILHVSDANTCS